MFMKVNHDQIHTYYGINFTMNLKRTKKHRTTEEEMEGPTSSGGSRNRLTCLNLQEHDDDDDEFEKNAANCWIFSNQESKQRC